VSKSSAASGDSVAVNDGRMPGDAASAEGALFDLSGIDLAKHVLDRAELEYWIPHRGEMSLLDAVVWHNDECSKGVAVKHITDDQFWVPGHFPTRPVFPGVLMIESAAQLSCILFNKGRGAPTMPSFLRIGHASFRNVVTPGNDLYLLCDVTKGGRRRFVCDVQGIVGDKIAFDAEITGMSVGDLDL
jgi:3-hydroxyacyl-[acyl-carrier-protein] dehydratase